MLSLRESMSRSRNDVVVGYLARVRIQEREAAAKREAELAEKRRKADRRYAIQERDKALKALYEIAYVRLGKFVPKKRTYRDKMNEMLSVVSSWAVLCRVEHPVKPPLRDPEFRRPNNSLHGRARLLDERDRLIEWADVLEERGEFEKMANVMSGVYQLEIRLGMRRCKVEMVRDGEQYVQREHYVFIGEW